MVKRATHVERIASSIPGPGNLLQLWLFRELFDALRIKKVHRPALCFSWGSIKYWYISSNLVGMQEKSPFWPIANDNFCLFSANSFYQRVYKKEREHAQASQAGRHFSI